MTRLNQVGLVIGFMQQVANRLYKPYREVMKRILQNDYFMTSQSRGQVDPFYGDEGMAYRARRKAEA